MNKVILLGNVGKDPEIVNFQNGGKKASFSLAVSEGYKNKDGDWVDKTEWFNIQSMNEKRSEYIEKNIKKGYQLIVEGKLKTEEWTTKEGESRSRMVVDLSGFDGVSIKIIKKPDGVSVGASSDQGQQGGASPAPAQGSASSDEDNDDLPFN
jgi:single-strand DNA-binding protein